MTGDWYVGDWWQCPYINPEGPLRDSGVFLAGGPLPALTTVCTFANHAAAPPSPAIISVRRRPLRQATATIARRRQLPSETFRFAPSRRSSLRSFRVLATYCRLSLRSFRVLATLSLAPALHAVPSRHPFTWPWAAMGFARAQPAPASPTTAPACLANITHRLLSGNSPATLTI